MSLKRWSRVIALHTPSTKIGPFSAQRCNFGPLAVSSIPERYKRAEIAIKLLRSEIAQALKGWEAVPGARLE